MKDIDYKTGKYISINNIQTETTQSQDTICPFCFDDHSSIGHCVLINLRKEILTITFNEFLASINNEKQDASLPDKIKKMIKWL